MTLPYRLRVLQRSEEVAMAEGVVAMLILKLGSALAIEIGRLGTKQLCHEAFALSRFFSEIRDIKEELESMQSFLQGAERFKDTDNTTANFIKNIRGLAFDIEDVVDEFAYKLDHKHGGFAATMTRPIDRILVWRRLTSKLREIKLKLENVDRRKVRYDMRAITKGGSSDAHYKSTDQISYFPKDEDIVGIDENKELLMNWLRGDMQYQTVIVTVWGMGGVGKTTLVAHVYNTVKIDFDSAAWITVSKVYQVEDLLKQIIRGFQKSDLKGELRVDIIDMEKRSLVEIIRDYLCGKSYILVLDDVWSNDIWFNIREAFPNNSNSRFIITSRIHEVALLGTGNCIIELKPLEEHYSWELFCKEAFWKNENKICPQELNSLAQKFVDKCNGLPIALACIGRLLSCKSPSYAEWESLYKEIELQITNNVVLNVNIVLKVSLEDLPYTLKNCFLHCTLFPEDYLLKRKRLIRHWIAEGFIRKTEHKTMEDVAEGFLYELVNRSLLQVVERNESGRVRSCRMHDIIRLLALTKSNEESFGKVYDVLGSSSAGNTRRLSIQTPNIEQLTRSKEVHVRSVYAFNNVLTSDSLKSFLKSFYLISTLDLQGTQFMELPDEVFNLFNLRFLGLRDTEIRNIPETVGRLKKLEVLDAYNAKLLTLPESVSTLENLRYLCVATNPKNGIKGVVPWIGIKVPNGIRHLTGLQALRLVEASSETLCHLGALKELRTFAITKVQKEQCADLCNAIMNMKHLVSLAIMAINEKETLQLEKLCLPSTLSKLEIGGQLDKKVMPQIVSSFSDLGNLMVLALAFSKLDEESFSCILALRGLRGLWLDKAYEGKRLHFNAMSFPKLQQLAISDAPYLKSVIVEKGALQNLVQLTLVDCPELKSLPDGIEHLTTLEKFYLRGASKELTKQLQQKEEPYKSNKNFNKINHIRRVIVYP